METLLKSMDLDFLSTGKHKITAEKMFKNKEAVLLDVRTTQEVEALTINTNTLGIPTLNIPVDQIPHRLSELPNNKLIAIFCPHNSRSGITYAYLKAKGFSNCKILVGGYASLTAEINPKKLLASTE